MQVLLISIQYLFSFIFIFICLAGMVLLIAKLFMQNGFLQAVRQNTLVNREYGTLNQQIAALNKKISSLKTVQDEFFIWSIRLAALSAIVPPNIELRSLNAASDGALQLSGYAATRDSLLLFKQNLEKSGIISEVTLPLENLFDPTDIDFAITGRLSVK